MPKSIKIFLQIQLENNFFNNHPSSVKKTVEFVTDRIFSVIIKEIISKDITQAKEAASLKFLNIKSTNKVSAFQKIYINMARGVISVILINSS